MSLSKEIGALIGVSVGPGDPELLTLKAINTLKTCPVICYLCNERGTSMAQSIASPYIPADGECVELPITMPMCNDRAVANQVYDRAALEISQHLDAGRDVAFLCEGDSLLFGSFSYLLDRLSPRYGVLVIPGVNSISAAASALAISLARLTENFAIISGRNDDQDILNTLQQFDNVAIMKPGRKRARLIELIQTADRVADARYVEYVGQPGERIINDILQLPAKSGPYFSLFLVTRHGGESVQ